MAPYLDAFYSLHDTTDIRDELCRQVLPDRHDITSVRQAFDEIARMAARPAIVRERTSYRLFTHLGEMLTILEQARLSDTRLAHEVAAMLPIARDGCEKNHPNFPRGSTLPDWVGRALPILHVLWCQGSRHHGVHKRKDQVSPALQFMTDAINLFIPGTTVSSINYLWPKVKHESPK